MFRKGFIRTYWLFGLIYALILCLLEWLWGETFTAKWIVKMLLNVIISTVIFGVLMDFFHKRKN